MHKRPKKIIEIPCTESVKPVILQKLWERFENDERLKNSVVEIKADRFECIDVIVYEGDVKYGYFHID